MPARLKNPRRPGNGRGGTRTAAARPAAAPSLAAAALRTGAGEGDASLEKTGEEMIGAQMVLRAMVDNGVEHVFGYPGGAVLPVYDMLYGFNRLRHILVRHEQAAVHAAEGYARSTGKVGCVLVTSGPGATNAVTGLTDALMDSIPLVCFSGQVPTHLIGNDAFQEADTTGITRACTKHNYLVRDVADLPRVLHEAFAVAASGRPGPVLVDLPKDVQQASGLYRPPEAFADRPPRFPRLRPDPDSIDAALDILSRAERPIIYFGGGVINSGPHAARRLAAFARELGFPVTGTLMGLGAFPADDPLFLGMVGMHGSYESNLAMHGSDAMLCVGARFDDRVTGKTSAFAPDARKIHIDIDASSIDKNILVDVRIVADAGDALAALQRGWQKRGLAAKKEPLARWWRQIAAWRGRDCFAYRQPASGPIKPQHAIVRLDALTQGRDAYFTSEVGQHQMWAAQYIRFNKPNRWMTSGGLGTMGYGLPAAIGVQTAHPEALVVDVAGEASIMMNIQELSTAAQHKLPVKVFILNNEWMGMVRQWQELIYDKRYSESYSASLPDFAALAEAFGIKGLKVEKAEELDDAILAFLDHPGPALLDCRVVREENCFPMIPAGAAHNEVLLAPPSASGSPASAGSHPGATDEGLSLV